MLPCIVNLYYNKPTRCSCSQSVLFHCRVTLHVSGAFHTHHQEYIKLYLQPLVRVMLSLEEGSCNDNMARTRGCRYSLMYSDDGCGKQPKHVEWPCSEIKLTANTFVMLFVCLSICVEKLGSLYTDLCEVLYWEVFLNLCRENTNLFLIERKQQVRYMMTTSLC